MIAENAPLKARLELLLVRAYTHSLNFFLDSLCQLLLLNRETEARDILIYKIGNVGDITCAIPALMAIRKRFSDSRITLLTSPGKRASFGAKELLSDVPYLDDMAVYCTEDLATWQQKKEFIKNLRSKKFDLFIQLPDDIAKFRTLVRNMLFAKSLGVRRAFGFTIRTVRLFKKTQIDFTSNQTEVESLLELLRAHGISSNAAEFCFNISEGIKEKIQHLLTTDPSIHSALFIVALSPGGKRETNRWPVERFAETARYLIEKYNAHIVILGGPGDTALGEAIGGQLPREHFSNQCGKLELLETVEFLRHSRLVIANSTGTIHLAAAVGTPAVGIYGVRDILNRWFPYGAQHRVLYHKFLDCDYNREECIKKSIDTVTVPEVEAACDDVLQTKIKS
jgi:ADP-heptose:LPS heptosyltransferase